ncbi:MAG: carbon storage regulator [Thermoguttaceae bacterium]|jgi:carbon storage regulator
MLVLSRSCDTAIRIGSDITVKVLEIHKGRVKLGIEAPKGLSVWREELLPITDGIGSSIKHYRSRSQQPCIAKPHGRHS